MEEEGGVSCRTQQVRLHLNHEVYHKGGLQVWFLTHGKTHIWTERPLPLDSGGQLWSVGQLWWTVMECWKTEVDRCAVIIGQLLDSCGVVSGQLLCDFWTAVLDSCCAGQLWCDYWTAVLDSSQQCVSLCCHSWCLRVQLTGLPGLNLHLHLHPQPGDSKPHCSIITRVITVVEDLMSFSFLSPLILSSHLHQPA